MPREDLLTTDKEKARAKAEIHRFLTRLAVFAALCGVLFGVVFGLAVVPGSAMAPRLCGGDLVLFSRFERGTAAGRSCSTGRTARSTLGASRRVAAIPSL